MSGKHFDDVIALGAWGCEFHDEKNNNWESSFRIPPGGYFEIPLACLQSLDTSNLFVAGRCVDADQYATSAVRVMGTALATGQAAGVAAGLISQSKIFDIDDVQSCLRANGAFLDPSRLPDAGPICD